MFMIFKRNCFNIMTNIFYPNLKFQFVYLYQPSIQSFIHQFIRINHSFVMIFYPKYYY
jgi:hypothetical protein